MFCTNCGCAHSDSAAFCPQCGASLTVKEPAGEGPVTKAEYFANDCSNNAKKKKKTIKVLSAVSLAVQCVMNLLVILGLVVLADRVHQIPLVKVDTTGLGVVVIFSLIATIGSFVLTGVGVKKNSTGFFAWATIFAFLSATCGSMAFGSVDLRRLVAFGVLALHIVITVLNHQNSKEYKTYLNGK